MGVGKLFRKKRNLGFATEISPQEGFDMSPANRAYIFSRERGHVLKAKDIKLFKGQSCLASFRDTEKDDWENSKSIIIFREEKEGQYYIAEVVGFFEYDKKRGVAFSSPEKLIENIVSLSNEPELFSRIRREHEHGFIGPLSKQELEAFAVICQDFVSAIGPVEKLIGKKRERVGREDLTGIPEIERLRNSVRAFNSLFTGPLRPLPPEYANIEGGRIWWAPAGEKPNIFAVGEVIATGSGYVPVTHAVKNPDRMDWKKFVFGKLEKNGRKAVIEVEGEEHPAQFFFKGAGNKCLVDDLSLADGGIVWVGFFNQQDTPPQDGCCLVINRGEAIEGKKKGNTGHYMVSVWNGAARDQIDKLHHFFASAGFPLSDMEMITGNVHLGTSVPIHNGKMGPCTKEELQSFLDICESYAYCRYVFNNFDEHETPELFEEARQELTERVNAFNEVMKTNAPEIGRAAKNNPKWPPFPVTPAPKLH